MGPFFKEVWCVSSVFFHQIAEEEALMPVALFPVIQEIDICSNPLTVRRSGNHPSFS